MHNMNDSQTPSQSFSSRAVVSTWHLAVGVLFLSSCTLMPSIAIIRDDRVERLIREEASKILAVTEDAANTSQYETFLTDFPRADILGMSIGGRRIYVSYKLASRASFNQRHLWMLRQTLAHEIAHEIGGRQL